MLHRKKKRRRIKNIDDTDDSDSDTENEGRNKHGRKNIRKVKLLFILNYLAISKKFEFEEFQKKETYNFLLKRK